MPPVLCVFGGSRLRWADVIDTHCHLTFPVFSGPQADRGVERELADAAAAGVSGVITIATTTQDCVRCLEIARRHERVWCTAGIHPLYSHRGPHVWDHLRDVIEDAKCVAWGELGLDNHYPDPPRDVQRAVLEEQLQFMRACREARLHRRADEREVKSTDKPVVIHCREAFADLIPILRTSGIEPGRFVFHCFTGTPADMRMVLDFGAMVSFTGVVTYRNAPEVREAAKLVPDDRIMVETDAPFLSPEPVRRERPCRPAMVRHTAEALAALRGVSFEAFHERINANTRAFFGIDAR